MGKFVENLLQEHPIPKWLVDRISDSPVSSASSGIKEAIKSNIPILKKGETRPPSEVTAASVYISHAKSYIPEPDRSDLLLITDEIIDGEFKYYYTLRDLREYFILPLQ